ncbi:MAG: phenylacetate-CoA oxygenase subunit PaaI [Cyclobacteriaceae bacterium]|nr:MAG: phenylacetate-CoA oxygenase subunit PaaI [Cyclobacteriaceae bacterium]
MKGNQSQSALKKLLYNIADDLLILGHRNSEWTGIGPLLEEDIAFSSMAQDKIGQSLAIYELLHQLGEPHPDTVAFMRNANQFHNCQLVELPIGEYQFSLVRHFLFDHSLLLRFQGLTDSSYEPLAQVSQKLVGELRYHVMHADSFIRQLGTANEDSIGRMQTALDIAVPYALGIFEKSPEEEQIISEGIFTGEQNLYDAWCREISKTTSLTSLKLPELNPEQAITGGRQGKHTKHLQLLLDEMAEVFKLEPGAEW